MCRKIRCDEESCKVFGFWVYLNKALYLEEVKKEYVVQVAKIRVFSESLLVDPMHNRA